MLPSGLPAALTWLAEWARNQYGLVVKVSAGPLANSHRSDIRTLLVEFALGHEEMRPHLVADGAKDSVLGTKNGCQLDARRSGQQIDRAIAL